MSSRPNRIGLPHSGVFSYPMLRSTAVYFSNILGTFSNATALNVALTDSIAITTDVQQATLADRNYIPVVLLPLGEFGEYQTISYSVQATVLNNISTGLVGFHGVLLGQTQDIPSIPGAVAILDNPVIFLPAQFEGNASGIQQNAGASTSLNAAGSVLIKSGRATSATKDPVAFALGFAFNTDASENTIIVDATISASIWRNDIDTFNPNQ